ncbi:MAG: tRNA-specific 2-thiouridylase [Desulfovibrio sp.]|nr:tRNA-specific 2-thiouridylase [Desulfovibrio sp.]
MYLAVALSGGLDSLAALLRLKKAGHKLLALHATFWPSQDDLPKKLGELVAKLGITYYAINLEQEFAKEVLSPSLKLWQEGATPNPCAFCNEKLKFGYLWHFAKSQGCLALATGHYASLKQAYGTLLLAPPKDLSKDQSYFLSHLEPQVLPNLNFPLANFTKDENRALLKSEGLSPICPKESQDLCFLPNDKEERNKALLNLFRQAGYPQPKQGPIEIFDQGQLKQSKLPHQGLWRYTEGQRKGLGISSDNGLYVLKKDYPRQTLIIGPKNLLGLKKLVAKDPHFFCPRSAWPTQVLAKVRLSQKPCQAKVVQKDPMTLEVSFAEKILPTAKGQLLSITDQAGHILAGALIEETENIDCQI